MKKEVNKIKKIIYDLQNAPSPIGPYSQAIKVENFLFVSGQIAINTKTNELIDSDIERQTEQTLENIKVILEGANSLLENIIKVTIYLKDINSFSLVNNVYKKYFKANFPVRTCVEVSKLPKNAKIEIEVIAFKEAI